MKPLDSTWVLQSPGKLYSIGNASDMKKNGEDSFAFELRSGPKRWWINFFCEPFARNCRNEGNFLRRVLQNGYSSRFFPDQFTIENNRLGFLRSGRKNGKEFMSSWRWNIGI